MRKLEPEEEEESKVSEGRWSKKQDIGKGELFSASGIPNISPSSSAEARDERIGNRSGGRSDKKGSRSGLDR